MSNNIVIGIDPGSTGGIGITFQDRRSYAIYSSSSNDADAVASLCEAVKVAQCWATSYGGKIIAVVERVASFPGQGAVSTFTFGKRYGIIHGVLMTLKVPFVTVPPQTWQKVLGVAQPKNAKDPAATPKEKNKAKADRRKRQKAAGYALARMLYPELEITLENSDGILLAEYGIRTPGLLPSAS